MTDTVTREARAAMLAAGLRQVAAMVEANPGGVDVLEFAFSNVLAYVSGDNPRELIADATRATLAVGGTVDKYYSGDEWAGIVARFGPVSIQIYTGRAQMCERVVVGTREVVKEVPDPEALAAVPTVQTTVTEDVVEWVCRPIMEEVAA